MGECGRSMQIKNCATSVADDMSVARDIARRFEQLETQCTHCFHIIRRSLFCALKDSLTIQRLQWLSFQKKSSKWETDKDILRQATGCLPRNRLQEHPVQSPASSYSNPLFTNHPPLRSSHNGDRVSSASSRTGSPYAGPSLNPDRAPFSTRYKPAAISTSEQDLTGSKDDDSSSHVSPSAAHAPTSSSSMLSSPPETTARTSKYVRLSPSRDEMYTRATVPTFYNEKPPLSPANAANSKTSPRNNEHASGVSFSRLSLQSMTESRRDSARNLNLQENAMNHRPEDCCSQAKALPRDHTNNHCEIVESFSGALSISNPASSDPATYSSGKGPPGSQIPSPREQVRQSDTVHCGPQACLSRSPPGCAPRTSTETDLHLEHSPFDGSSQRNVSWRVLADRGILSEGVLGQKVHASEIDSEDEKPLSYQMPTYFANDLQSRKGNVLKLEVQIDKRDVNEADNVKLGDRLGRVNWELRLSKREAALRIAEEMLLEEQQKVSEAQLAVARCEDALKQREQAGKQEKERQRSELDDSVKSVETGKSVMKKLCAALKDVLEQLEQKEKVLQNAWLELKDSVDTGSPLGLHSYGFEPELSPKASKNATFDGISLLASEGKCEEWCSTVIGICERLVAFMSRETHLQKWASVLEKEGTRISKAKEDAKDQRAKAEAMFTSAEEQMSSTEVERRKLNKERENLLLWVAHLQERRKAVTECEREAATSLAEVQKKAADLFVHESCIDGRALEISALQEELRATSQRLHDDQEQMNREKHKVQEKLRQVASREREADSKLSIMKKFQEELDSKAEQLEKERLAEEKKKDKHLLALKEKEQRLNAKETSIQELEKNLEHKGAAAEEMTNNLSEREKLLKGLQRQLEQERTKIRELMADLERDKVRLKEAEEAISEAHISKKSAEEAWARTAKERREATDYLRSVEEHMKQWEDRLHCKEKELQVQQKNLQEVEARAREEQEHAEALHAKLVQEQATWTEEVKVKQENLAKRTKILEYKEAEIKNDLEKLTEERRLAIDEIKRFAEMEAQAWAAERDLQSKHNEHLQEVQKHAKEYRAHVEDLEVAKRAVEKEFEEVHAKKQELQIWQREAEDTLQNRIESFIKGKEELTAQINELKKLQVDIEQAGSQIIERVAELDQASTRLERQRHKVESSKSKLEVLADKLTTHQEVLKRRESDYFMQETKLVAVQGGLKRMALEVATKEKNLRFREQTVIDSENDLHELEARLANERKDLEKMIAEVEQHAATLKEETAVAEESTRHRTRDELLIEEKRENLQAKERDLAGYEADLKKKAKGLEEHGQTISKLEMQVKDRLQRAADLELRTSELEKGWEKLKEEQAALAEEKESLTRANTEIQMAATRQRTEGLQLLVDQEHQEKNDCRRKAWVREELEKQRAEMMGELRAKQAAIDTREAKAANREAGLLKLERESKDQVEKDAKELRQQLTGARLELEDQRRDVEEKRKAAEAFAVTIEEREVRLRLRERELERRDLSLLDPGNESNGVKGQDVYLRSKKVQSSEIGCRANYQLQEMLSLRVSGVEPMQAEGVQLMDKLDKGEERLVEDNGARELRAQSILLHKQGEESMEGRLRQMEDTFQKEAAKILQERANLKLQQKDLEETRKAVQEVKVTLTAQLKATKQMVADASITAQNASRERESLEDERKRLVKAQKDTEASLAAKESKLAVEAKQLENLKMMLEQEKAQAMEMIQQAAKRAVDAERAKAGGRAPHWETDMMHKESQCDANLKERERELSSTAEAIRREKTSLTEERAQVKLLHDALAREQMEQCQVTLKQAAQTDTLIKDEENRVAWEEIKKRREETRLIGEAHGWHPNPELPLVERRTASEREFNFPTLKGGIDDGSLGGDLGESSNRIIHQHHRPADTINNINTWDDSFGSTMLISSPSSSMVTAGQISSEKLINGATCAHRHEGNSVPSKKRLENVMTSLMHARQASRSRLQRTENALLAFAPSAGFTAQVQQALNALSARLSLMEQIEEGLASHLQKAYETESPESEGVIVDKVQLLCRMEEQQSLRAEWEEDMQRQLETISMLQAASRNSSNFNTPMKMVNQGPPSMNDWQSCGNSGLQGGKAHAAYEIIERSGCMAGTAANGHHQSGGGPKPCQHFSSPEWNTTFEPLLGVDSKGLSYSPLVDYNYINNPDEQNPPEFGIREAESHERNTRRKLHLSPPHMNYG